MMASDAAMLRREAEGDRDLELGQRVHLAVKPAESVGAKAVGPGETGPKMSHAQSPHPSHRFVQPVILKMEPLAQPHDIRRFGKGFETELRPAVLAQQPHVE